MVGSWFQLRPSGLSPRPTQTHTKPSAPKYVLAQDISKQSIVQILMALA